MKSVKVFFIVLVCYVMSGLGLYAQVGSDLDLVRQEHCYTAPSGTRTSYFKLYYQPRPGDPLEYIGVFNTDGTVYGGPTNDASDGFCEYCQNNTFLYCDDINGDTTVLVQYWKVVEMCDSGIPHEVGTFNYELSATYTPTNPIACCTQPGDEPSTNVDVRRYTTAATFTVGALTQSVSIYVNTVNDVGDPPVFTDSDGDPTDLLVDDEIHLHAGRSLNITPGASVDIKNGDDIFIVITKFN